jgi:hypothetical protein
MPLQATEAAHRFSVTRAASHYPAELARFVIGELPCASIKVNFMDWRTVVSSCMEQPQARNSARPAVFRHASGSRQCDDDIFIHDLNTE